MPAAVRSSAPRAPSTRASPRRWRLRDGWCQPRNAGEEEASGNVRRRLPIASPGFAVVRQEHVWSGGKRSEWPCTVGGPLDGGVQQPGPLRQRHPVQPRPGRRAARNSGRGGTVEGPKYFRRLSPEPCFLHTYTPTAVGVELQFLPVANVGHVGGVIFADSPEISVQPEPGWTNTGGWRGCVY